MSKYLLFFNLNAIFIKAKTVAKFYPLLICLVVTNSLINKADGQTWLASSATVDGLGYTHTGIGTYYRSTTGGTVTFSTGTACNGSTSTAQMGSSLCVFMATTANLIGFTLHGNSGTGSSRSLTSITTSTTLNGTYTNVTTASATGNLSGTQTTNFCSPSPMAISFGTTITAGTFIKITLTGNAYVAAIEFSTPLPINFTNVKAYYKNTGIQLEWDIAAETAIKNYEVQRSENADGFTTIASVIATANNGKAVNYNWFDVSPFKTNNYYRIKIIDANGEMKFSSIVKVGNSRETEKISVYPNPIEGNVVTLQLGGIADGKYDIQLFSSTGQQMMNTSITKQGVVQTQTLNLPLNMSAGIYRLSIRGEDGTIYNRNIIKL